MLTLNLSAYEMQQLEQASQQAGMTVNQYAVSRLFPQPPKLKTIADFVKVMPNRSYLGDGLAIQKEMRNDWD